MYMEASLRISASLQNCISFIVSFIILVVGGKDGHGVHFFTMYYPYDFFKNSNLFGKSRKIVAFFMILNEVVLLSLNQY